MPDPTQIEVQAEAVIAEYRAMLAQRDSDLAIKGAIIAKLSQELDAAYVALEAQTEKPTLKVAGDKK